MNSIVAPVKRLNLSSRSAKKKYNIKKCFRRVMYINNSSSSIHRYSVVGMCANYTGKSKRSIYNIKKKSKDGSVKLG